MKKALIYTFLMWWNLSIAWGQDAVQGNNWQSIYQQGMKYKDASNNKKALQFLERAYELHPSDSIMRDIASVYYDRGVYRKSINISQSLLKEDSLEADLVLIAKSHEKLNNADSALVYEKIIAQKDCLFQLHHYHRDIVLIY